MFILSAAKERIELEPIGMESAPAPAAEAHARGVGRNANLRE